MLSVEVAVNGSRLKIGRRRRKLIGEQGNIRMFYNVKIYYTNGNVVRYRQFPMGTYEQGLKDHYIRDMKDLAWYELIMMKIVGIFKK